MSTQSTEPSPKKQKRLSFVALLFSAIVFGLLAGLGGSMLLTHSLIQRPLQEQQAHISQQHVQYQAEITRLYQEIANQNEAIAELKKEINYLVMADSTGYLKELSSIQKENQTREQYFMQELKLLTSRIAQIESNSQQFNQDVEQAKNELERTDKTLRDDLRMLQSSLNDMSSKIQQIERRIDSR